MAARQKKSKTTAKGCKANTPSKIPAGAKRGKRTKRDPEDWHPEALAALRVSGLVEESINAVGVGRTTFFDHKRKNAEFAAEVDEIVRAHLQADGHRLARGAMLRAINGEEKIVIEYDAKGLKVSETKTRSWPASREKFMLACSLPETFGENEDMGNESAEELADRMREAFEAMTKTLKGPQD